MISHKKLWCYLCILVVPFHAHLVSSDVLRQECDRRSRNYTANSEFQSNLEQLSSVLPINASSSPTLFSTGSAGAIPNTVYALTLCRGDTANASACADCIGNAFRDAQQACPYNMDATVYYERCYLRFSYQNFLASADNTKRQIVPNGASVASPAATFDAAVGVLLAAVSDYAAMNSSMRFGTGVQDFDVSVPKIYAMAQCRPDIGPAECRDCLEKITRVMPKHFSRRRGGQILGLRCNYRFEVYPPFLGNPVLQLKAPAWAVAPSPDGDRPIVPDAADTPPRSWLVPAGESGRNPNPSSAPDPLRPLLRRRWREPPGKARAVPPAAGISTNRMSVGARVNPTAAAGAPWLPSDGDGAGKGGDGAVDDGDGAGMSATVLGGRSWRRGGAGRPAQIWALRARSGEGGPWPFWAPAPGCGHPPAPRPSSSAPSAGCCCSGRVELSLAPSWRGGSGRRGGRCWVAGDASLRWMRADLLASPPLISGYMPPEYVVRGHYSTKSDVFSFGILVLEIITGRRNCTSYNSEQSVDLLTDLVWEHWTKGTILEIADPLLTSSSAEDKIGTDWALSAALRRPGRRLGGAAAGLGQ
ncbi:hypothetical protein QYE76_040803 [Lolium multiflorum]|uniref:Gnk2-homologous domain-containing protein n=1 Tax=Lolium multiflorum TaxID=4521 RepID=A0AAD8TBT0_LOLMU|nr:hypothetical protein QYE76_040803 [Lolium multiflorum]